MSSSDAMLKLSFVYFQCVNERATYVKIDRVPVGVDLGHSKYLISFVVRWLSTTAVL